MKITYAVRLIQFGQVNYVLQPAGSFVKSALEENVFRAFKGNKKCCLRNKRRLIHSARGNGEKEPKTEINLFLRLNR